MSVISVSAGDVHKLIRYFRRFGLGQERVIFRTPDLKKTSQEGASKGVIL